MQSATRVLMFVGALALLAAGRPATAQFGEDAPEDSRLGRAETQRWRVGLTVRAVGGPCKGLFATVPVPSDWPEQTVKIDEEDISTSVGGVRYVMLEGGVKQMQVRIPMLNSGEQARALVTFEVTRSAILTPGDASIFVRPASPPLVIRKYLGVSPFIETINPKIQAAAKELRDEDLSAWDQVEVIYDWVRDNVEYQNGSLKGALAALNDGTGDCEELTSLFIALCRVNKIPARTVWVPDHCYPEFYLMDKEGNGYWLPCQAAGTRDFGGIDETRPVLQKGDNFRVPGKRERQRYVAEFLKGVAVRGGGDPKVKFHRELLSAE